MDATFVGIDVSKDWLDVHVPPSGESFRVDNAASGAHLARTTSGLEIKGSPEQLERFNRRLGR
jgi:transposase